MRSKLKNLLNNTSREQTFRAGEMLNLADVNRRDGQFTYAEGDQVCIGGITFCIVFCNSMVPCAVTNSLFDPLVKSHSKTIGLAPQAVTKNSKMEQNS